MTSTINDDGVLLHVGVHKTGTTALQGALASKRDELAELGVLYPGPEEAQHRAAMGLLGKLWGWRDRGGGEVRKSNFTKLAKQVRANSGRVIVSSEFFCEADDAQAAEAVKAFGKPVDVMITVRNLGLILPSSWQQYLKSGLNWWYTPWLKEMLENKENPRITASFWRRHDIGRVARTWSRAVGPEHVHVVVLSDDARDRGFRTTETLAGLPSGMLAHEDAANRSMTEAEAFTLLLLNKEIKAETDWITYQKLVRVGMVRGMVAERKPGKDEPKLATPDWALDRASELGGEMADVVRGLGVNVIGDINELGRRLPTPTPHGSAPMPIDAAVAAVRGMIGAVGTL